MWSLPIIVGLLSMGVIIVLLELLSFDKRSAGSLILTAIGFIYVGFAGDDVMLLLVNSSQAVVIWLLAYGGLRKNPLLIPFGLALHAFWDIGYLYLAEGAIIPEGYELFCVVVDLGLGGWLFFSFKRKSN